MEDIYYNVFTFLDIGNILAFSMVNKYFRNIYNGQMIWKNLLEGKFKNIEFFKVNQFETYKLCYILDKFAKSSNYGGCDSIDKIYKSYTFETILFDYKSTKIPKSLCYLNNLTNLSLDCCDYEIIPTELCNLINLQDLYLSQNKISIVPTELGNLENLENLSLSRNLINVLPTELGKLHNLKNLWVYSNPITILPTELGMLDKLEVLHAYRTDIIELPREFGQLNKLKEILVNVKIAIPDEIDKHIIMV
jgi:hypothetical protein